MADGPLQHGRAQGAGVGQEVQVLHGAAAEERRVLFRDEAGVGRHSARIHRPDGCAGGVDPERAVETAVVVPEGVHRAVPGEAECQLLEHLHRPADRDAACG